MAKKQLPNECKMPDISSSIEYPLQRRLLPVLMGGFERDLDDKEKMYLRNFVRLVDKSINEYNEARNAIIKEIQETQSLYVFEFADHIENCINAFNRLLKQLDRIKSGRGVLKISRDTKKRITEHSS
jgi:hypothetical protein